MPSALDIECLQVPAPAFATFTYPRYRHFVRGEPGANDRIELTGSLLFAARHQGRPVGAALLGPPTASGSGRRLLSIMVAASARRQGVATSLLREVAAWARLQPGLQQIHATHSDRTRCLEAYLGLMVAAGWQGPHLLQQRLAGRVDWTHRVAQAWAGWHRRLDRQGFAMTRLGERTPADDANIAALEQAGRVEADLRLGPCIASADPDFSFLVRRRGEVAGWIVGERSRDVDGIHYTLGYVIPELRPTGWLIRGLWDACRYQEAALGPDSVAVYETSATNGPMQRMMLERLEPLGPLWVDRRYSLHWQVPFSGKTVPI